MRNKKYKVEISLKNHKEYEKYLEGIVREYGTVPVEKMGDFNFVFELKGSGGNVCELIVDGE